MIATNPTMLFNTQSTTVSFRTWIDIFKSTPRLVFCGPNYKTTQFSIVIVVISRLIFRSTFATTTKEMDVSGDRTNSICKHSQIISTISQV